MPSHEDSSVCLPASSVTTSELVGGDYTSKPMMLAPIMEQQTHFDITFSSSLAGHSSYTPPLIRSFPSNVLCHYPECRPDRPFNATAITTVRMGICVCVRVGGLCVRIIRMDEFSGWVPYVRT